MLEILIYTFAFISIILNFIDNLPENSFREYRPGFDCKHKPIKIFSVHK